MRDPLRKRDEVAPEHLFEPHPEGLLSEDEAADALGFDSMEELHYAWPRGDAPKPVRHDGVFLWREWELRAWQDRELRG
jgi:hypothetical protein